MSYILEALKKSEQERTRGNAPSLHAIHAETFRETRYPPWLYLTASAALLAAILLGWLRPWQSAKITTEDQLSSPIAAEAQQPDHATPKIALSMPVAVQRPAIAEPQEQAAPAPHKSHKEKVKAKKAPAIASVTPQEAIPQDAPVAKASSKQEAVDFSELPSGTPRSMPKLAISGYINNPGDPAGQMLVVGDKVVREGEEVTTGVKLEQLGNGGALFSYKGHRFRMPLP